MAKFSHYQNRVVSAHIISDDGTMREFQLKRIMIEWVDNLVDGVDEKKYCAAAGINPYDIDNWKKDFPEFRDYITLRLQARAWSNSINSDFAYRILGLAALGKMKLDNTQISALKLIMQGKGTISANGNKTKDKDKAPITSFEIEES
jgi:hypothetical protein